MAPRNRRDIPHGRRPGRLVASVGSETAEGLGLAPAAAA